MKRWRAVVGLLGLVGLAVAAYTTVDDVRDQALPSARALGLSLLLLVVAMVFVAQAWIALFPSHVDRAALARGLYTSQLTKYLPAGGFVQAASQVALSSQDGVASAAIRLPVFSLCTLAAAATVGSGLAFDADLPEWARVLAGLGLASVAVLDRRLLRRILQAARRWTDRVPEASTLPSQGAVVRCYLAMVVNMLAYSLAFTVLLGDLTNVRPWVVLAAFPAAWGLGYLVLPVPSGLGVREAVLVAALPGVPAGSLLAASVANRLSALVVEAGLVVSSQVRAALSARQTKSEDKDLEVTFIGPVPPLCSGPAQHGAFLADVLGERAHITVRSWQHQYPKLLFRHAQRDGTAAAYPGAVFSLRWWDPISWWRAGRSAQTSDVLVLTWITPFHALPSMVMMHAARPARVVAIVHNAKPHEALPFQERLTRWVLGSCDGLVAHSTTVAHDLAGLVPNVDVVVTPMPPHVTVQAHPLPTAGQELRLVFFGFVRPYKGVDIALEALAILRERGFKARLTVAGEFWEPVEPWYRRIEDLGLNDHVEIRPGYVSDSAVDALLAEHHAVVMPYRSATQSGVVPVAMAAARPVIASRVGGLAEFVTDGVNGTLAEPGDAASLADAIERCGQRLDDLAEGTQKCLTSWEDVADAVLKAAGLSRQGWEHKE